MNENRIFNALRQIRRLMIKIKNKNSKSSSVKNMQNLQIANGYPFKKNKLN